MKCDICAGELKKIYQKIKKEESALFYELKEYSGDGKDIFYNAENRASSSLYDISKSALVSISKLNCTIREPNDSYDMVCSNSVYDFVISVCSSCESI